MDNRPQRLSDLYPINAAACPPTPAREPTAIELVQQQLGFQIERANEVLCRTRGMADRLADRIHGPLAKPANAKDAPKITTPEVCRMPLADQAKALEHLTSQIIEALSEIDRLV